MSSHKYKKIQQPVPYEITMGTYRAHFRGKPQDYWQTTYFDFFSAITAMVLLIGLFLGVTVLIVNWSYYYGTQSYTIALSAATLLFIVIFLIINYFMSKGKRKKQKQIMKQAIRKFRQQHKYSSSNWNNSNQQSESYQLNQQKEYKRQSKQSKQRIVRSKQRIGRSIQRVNNYNYNVNQTILNLQDSNHIFKQ